MISFKEYLEENLQKEDAKKGCFCGSDDEPSKNNKDRTVEHDCEDEECDDDDCDDEDCEDED